MLWLFRDLPVPTGLRPIWGCDRLMEDGAGVNEQLRNPYFHHAPIEQGLSP